MNDFGWLVVNHVHTELSLHNTWQEALVNELTILSNNVLLAECHKFINGLLLLVVVDSLLQVQDGGSSHLTLLAFLDLAHPDTFALGSTVLLHDTDSSSNALWEVLLEGWDVIVGVGVSHTAGKVGNLHESILGSHLLHDIRVLHWGLAHGSNFSEQVINLALGNTRISSRVDSGDEAITLLEQGLHLVVLGVRVVHRNALPVLFDQGVRDWDGVSSVSIGLLITSTFAFNQHNLSSRRGRLWQEKWQPIFRSFWCFLHRSDVRFHFCWSRLLGPWGIYRINWCRTTATHLATTELVLSRVILPNGCQQDNAFCLFALFFLSFNDVQCNSQTLDSLLNFSSDLPAK